MSIPRGGGLCERTVSLLAPGGAITGGDDGTLIFEVPDLTVEPAYMDEDFVKNYPYMRYYAGVPLRTKNGFSIGSLCVIDDQVRPEGLKQEHKLTLVKMAETVMGHLETIRAQKDMKRGRCMEMGISNFLAENFRRGRADLDDGMGDGGGLNHEDKKQEKRSMQAERLKWVDQEHQKQMGERGAIGEDVKTTKVSVQSTNEWNRRKESDPFARDFATGLNRGSTTPEDIWPESSNIGLTKVKTSQLPLSFPSLQPEGFDSGIQPGHCPGPITPPELSRKGSYSSIRSRRSMARTRASGSTTSASSLDATIPPSSPSDSLFRDSDSFTHYSAVTTPTGQLQTPPPDANNLFRSTFARASVLIRKSIDVDGVVFVDADLEDTYNIDDYMETPEATLAAPSFDIGPDSMRQRPKKCRRRSGILGFATKSGSSCLNPFNSDSMLCRRGSELERSLGFDIGEVDEPFLHSVAERWPQGRIFSECANHDPYSENAGKEVETLKRFLPGVKNVICMPLYDFSGKLFAVGFGWSCSKTRIFCEDVERNYMAAFGNSIMAEVGRLHCVSGTFRLAIV